MCMSLLQFVVWRMSVINIVGRESEKKKHAYISIFGFGYDNNRTYQSTATAICP